MNPHVHLHMLATDGAFDRDGQLHRMPFDMQQKIAVLKRLFEHRVLDLMVEHNRLSERLRDDKAQEQIDQHPERYPEDCVYWDEADGKPAA